ncbi:hypothetical protein [Hymenobacter convexus]|uniref:hypothetical protein n=1 Tax=Hymenobacter sp. CA1UV-4 TaxID=3063782 RepID=UPI002713E049|nr:hypothetical protein [Hymenobacter sp. CA1UV-4]MDO7853782.1 hypothetical protein [Hymenobacter sp. CA1UV-4]
MNSPLSLLRRYFMKNYQAKSLDSKHFKLTQADTEIGLLEYESWFSFKAEIILANHHRYAVQPKGFWGTTIEVKDQQEQVLLDFKMNWKGQILIRTLFGGQEDYYILKQKGLLRSTFVLLHGEETELLSLAPDFKWTRLNFDYELVASDALEQLPGKELLLLTAIHCANYYLTMMTAAAA